MTVEGVPLASIPEAFREKVREVIAQPTLHTRGPVEVFRGNPSLYQWLLDHPDRAVTVWRRMGARCTEIADQGGGRFGWTDHQGGEIHWDTVFRGPRLRIWFAEGAASPGALFPAAPVRAVVVLRYADSPDPAGRTLIRHQAELFMQTDSKALALMTRLIGSSAPQLAEQCVGQMEIFFSALVWYFDRHPERANSLLLGTLPPNAPATAQLRQILEAAQARALRNGTSYNGARIVTATTE